MKNSMKSQGYFSQNLDIKNQHIHHHTLFEIIVAILIAAGYIASFKTFKSKGSGPQI